LSFAFPAWSFSKTLQIFLKFVEQQLLKKHILATVGRANANPKHWDEIKHSED